MPDHRLVLRPIPAEGSVLQAGEVVDVSGWRNVNALVRSGRLSRDQVAAPAAAVKKAAKKKPAVPEDGES